MQTLIFCTRSVAEESGRAKLTSSRTRELAGVAISDSSLLVRDSVSGSKTQLGDYPMMKKSTCRLAMLVLVFSLLVAAQDQKSAAAKPDSSPAGKGVDYLLNYLNMAGTMTGPRLSPVDAARANPNLFENHDEPLGLH